MTAAIRTASALALAVALGATLASCAPTPEPTPTSTPPVTSVTPTPTATAAPGDEGAAVGFGCDDLLSPDDIYAFNPNTAIDDSYVGSAGSEAATAVELGGIACSWVNQSSGDRFTISVSHPSSEQLAEFASEAESAPRAVGYDGTFEGDDNGATTTAIVGPYFLTGDFAFFVEQGDVTPLMLEAIDELDD